MEIALKMVWGGLVKGDADLCVPTESAVKIVLERGCLRRLKVAVNLLGGLADEVVGGKMVAIDGNQEHERKEDEDDEESDNGDQTAEEAAVDALTRR